MTEKGLESNKSLIHLKQRMCEEVSYGNTSYLDFKVRYLNIYYKPICSEKIDSFYVVNGEILVLAAAAKVVRNYALLWK